MGSFIDALRLKSAEEAKTDYLKNADLLPMKPERRTWGYASFLFFWVIDKTLVGSWNGAAALLSAGFNVRETIGIILISYVIIVILAVCNAQIGANYFIGFTVSMRTIFGIRGSYLAVAMRGILSIVWYASQCWMGGLCVNCLLSSWSKSYMYMENTFPLSVNFTSQQLVGFVIFQVISIPLLFVKPEKLKPYMISSSCFSFLAMCGLLIASLKTKNHKGLGDLMSSKTTLSGSEYSWTFLYLISSNFGGIASGAANSMDYSRFSQAQKGFPFISSYLKKRKAKTSVGLDDVEKEDNKLSPFSDISMFAFGTTVSYFTVGIIVPVFGLITASTMKMKYGVAYWKPTDFMMVWLEDNYSPAVRAGVCFASACFIYAQVSFNVLGNAVAAGMDLSGIAPQFLNIRRGAILCALLVWPVQPNLFYNTSSTFVTVMSSFSVFMTPLIGCLICDFLLIRKRQLKLSELFTDDPSGAYWYWKGFNLRGLFAFFCAAGPGLAGLINAANPNIPISVGAQRFYDGIVFFSFAISFCVYYIAHRIFPMKGINEVDSIDYFNVYTKEELEAKNLTSYEDWLNGNSSDVSSEVESELIIEEDNKGIKV